MAVDIPNTKYYQLIRSVRRNTRPYYPPSVEEPRVPVDPPETQPIFMRALGVKINGYTIGGIKKIIETTDTLAVPQYWQYNVRAASLNILGIVNCYGEINIES